MKGKITRHLYLYRWYILAFSVIFLAGVVIGSLSINYLPANILEQYQNEIAAYINYIPNASWDMPNEMRFALIQNSQLILGFWLLGMMIIGLPLIVLLLFYRGILLGITLSLILQNSVGNGITVILMLMLPQILVLLPIMVLAASRAWRFSIIIAKGQVERPIFRFLLNYSFYYLILLFGIIIVSFIQGYLGPSLVQLLFHIIS